MPLAGEGRIARPLDGVLASVPIRDHFETHSFIGANAFMLDLMADHAEELGVIANPEAMRHIARLTRRFLSERTARLSATAPVRTDGRLRFTLTVENLAGHKFPSAYPSRRAWLEIVVRRKGEILFQVGVPDQEGRIESPGERPLPHLTTIRSPRDRVVYEVVPGDGSGRPTTRIAAMAERLKDNRLLPRGWHPNGPYGDETAPVGTDGDPDFEAGSDQVEVDIPIPRFGRLTVNVRLLYQAIPPSWVDPLRNGEGDAARRFVRLYDSRAARTEVIDTLEFTVR